MARGGYSEHLRAVPLFAHCTPKQLEEIGRVADELRLPAGRTLVQQGDVGLELLIIVEGTAEVVRDGTVVNHVGPGGFIGEMAVLTDAPRNATVVAKSDVTVLVLTRRGLDQLLDDVPGLAKQLLFEVVSRISPTDR
jgi:CRP/FNR family transcriptional regulator, cyclic AMP receptor protein